jgi:hypothetical protein
MSLTLMKRKAIGQAVSGCILSSIAHADKYF